MQPQLNADEGIQLLGLLQDFEELFSGTLGYWDTVPVNLELNPGSSVYATVGVN